MRYAITSLIAAVTFAGTLLAAQSCLAMNDELPTLGEQPAVADLAAFGRAASDDELGLESGGQAMEVEKIYLQLNNVGMNAEMDGNALDSNLTGTNFIGYDAFSNMNGFATVIQNSGNQVIIQSDLIVNVTMK